MTDTNDRLAGLSDAKRAMLERLVAERRAAAAQVRPRPRPERVPLSFGQERLWLVEQITRNTSAYHVPVALRLEGALDADALDRAMQEVVRRHETLRTGIPSEAGRPYQQISGDLHFAIDRTDVSAAADPVAAAWELGRIASAKPFDLTRGPLLRVLLARMAPESHLLVLVVHHLMIDGWSIGVLLGELSHLYNAFRDGKPSPLPNVALQYADYAMWQREWLDGERMDKQVAYWREQLDGCPSVLDIPADRARPPVQSFRGAVAKHTIPADLYEEVENFSRRENVTPFMTLFAAWTTLLHRWTGQNDLPVGVGLANRPRAELESIVGFFVNTLVLRADLSGEPTFRELLAQVRGTTLGAQANQDAPLSRVLETMKVDRAASHMPFLQTMMFFQSYSQAMVPMNGLTVSRISLADIDPGAAQTDISLYVNSDGPGDLQFQYSTDLFDADTIARLSGNLIVLIGAALKDPDVSITRLPLLTEAEQAQLAAWNDTRAPYADDRPLIALLTAQMERTPEAMAVTFNGRVMTYGELRCRSNELARELRARGIGAGSLVGLYVERSLEMLIGLVAILEAGGAYVPLDPSYPADRLAYMLGAAEAKVVVTTGELRGSVPVQNVDIVLADATAPLEDVAPIDCGATPDDLAYVIFTSGSTGKPKGVQITQRSAANLLASVAREPGMQAGDSICAVSTLSFDIDGAALARLVDASRVTVMQATPATWRMLLEIGWRGKSDLKIITTGEACPRELADRLATCCKELWNLYGPTETTVYSALGPIVPAAGPISIGRPVANTQIHIVDRNFQPLPVGVPGELLIGGDGLARGYLGRPDLTSEKFIPDPFSTKPGARVYRAGDLALWRRDGTLEVVGRMDHQVKLRGFRIELGEIEAALAECAGVEQAVVHCREDRPGDKRLVAYVTLASVTANATLTADVMRAHLRKSLPDYMIPSAFLVLEAFPLTPNGKVDRKALPAPDAAGAAAEGELPRTPEEQQMAALWGEVLGRLQIKRDDNFFNLGGHSLLATQMLARLHNTFGVEVPLRVLFDAPTLSALSAHVATAKVESLAGEDLDALLAQLEGMSDDEVRGLSMHGEQNV
jgi:non-ribosomal peptide synthetase component F/acyl carrier protein